MLDFEVGVGEVLLTFRAGNPTSGGVPVEISNSDIPTSEFKWNAPFEVNANISMLICSQ